MTAPTAPIQSVDHEQADTALADGSGLGLHESSAAVAMLAERWPDHAHAMIRNSRLAAALTAAQQATGLGAADVVGFVGARELDTAQRPIDVLVSRCLMLIKDHAASAEATNRAAPTALDESRDSEPTDDQPALPKGGVPFAPIPWFGPRSRVALGPPTLAGPDAALVAQCLIGNRYIAVLGAVGGAGATTTTVMLGHVLATCRTDQVVATEVSPRPGALAFRSGGDSVGSVRSLVDAEGGVHGCAELARFLDRLPTRLSIAKSSVGDPPLDANDYRRAIALLSRYYDLVITDIGMGTTAELTAPALGLADLVVIVTSPTTHGLRSAATAVDVAASHGVDQDHRVLFVNGVHRSSPVKVDEFAATVGPEVAATLCLPWDQHLHSGEAICLQQLHRSTVRAATHAAATMAQLIATPPN
jgi:MinD-like ATPase involved in chromosome partitioning or flagellar assembly